MKKVLLSLFIAFSFLVAPVAHATGIGCEGAGCQMLEQVKKHSDSNKQDDGKMTNAGHHCCCSHISVQLEVGLNEPQMLLSQAIFYSSHAFTRSVVVGPNLKPPSYA